MKARDGRVALKPWLEEGFEVEVEEAARRVGLSQRDLIELLRHAGTHLPCVENTKLRPALSLG